MGNHIYFEDLVYHDSVEQGGPKTVAAHDNENGGCSVSTETIISNGGFVAMVALRSVVWMNCFSSPASAEDNEDQKLSDSSNVEHKRKEEETVSLLGNNCMKKMKEPSLRLFRNPPNNLQGEQVAAGWPSWLSSVASEAINGWTPLDINLFQKLNEVQCYVHQLLSGLDHCHRKDVLHRNINTSNLFFDDEETRYYW
ncbi:hypothetical protein MKW94_004973, partial [Papaver nudicaule]|nr:hypothetical protein [Papaver nudicaule]